MLLDGRRSLMKEISKDLVQWCKLSKFIGKKLMIASPEMNIFISFEKLPPLKFQEFKDIIILDDIGE